MAGQRRSPGRTRKPTPPPAGDGARQGAPGPAALPTVIPGTTVMVAPSALLPKPPLGLFGVLAGQPAPEAGVPTEPCVLCGAQVVPVPPTAGSQAPPYPVCADIPGCLARKFTRPPDAPDAGEPAEQDPPPKESP